MVPHDALLYLSLMIHSTLLEMERFAFPVLYILCTLTYFFDKIHSVFAYNLGSGAVHIMDMFSNCFLVPVL